MAGHSKFKNIQHRKGSQDKKRAKIFTKLVREIMMAVKLGMPDPGHNPRLKSAIIAARNYNLPKDRIDKAISQASDPKNDEIYFDMRYEGCLPGGVFVIIEALTNNKNRAASDIKSTLTKFGGHLSEQGSVAFMFDHCGIIEYSNITDLDKFFEDAIELGVKDIESVDDTVIVYTDIENFISTQESLSKTYGDADKSEIGWNSISHYNVVIEDQERAETLLKLHDVLEDNDDVKSIFSNYTISDNIYQILLND
ncbi:MAG: YebC/PmpR family DNA-binding transcriptional regulator [Rickettsiaceae bacterium]